MAGSGGTTSGARRHWLKLIAALVVFLLVLFVPFGILAGLGFMSEPVCGCLPPPSPHPPGWTPTPAPPVSPEDAAARASRLAGVMMTPAPDWATIEGMPVSEPRGEGAFAFVDGNSGTVLEVVLEKQLPDSDTVSVSSDAASSAAQAFLSRGSVTTDGLAAQTTLALRASVAYYDVTWSAPGAGKPALEIRVNASSGAVFAYRDLRAGIELTAPNVGLCGGHPAGPGIDVCVGRDRLRARDAGSGPPGLRGFVVVDGGIPGRRPHGRRRDRRRCRSPSGVPRLSGPEA